MNRQRIGSLLAATAALGYIATAALHSTGYDTVTQLAQEADGDLRLLIPPLWLFFSFDLVLFGLIVGVVAVRPSSLGRVILVIAAASPLLAAVLQIVFIGFMPPTVILLTLAGLTLTAAAVLPTHLTRVSITENSR